MASIEVVIKEEQRGLLYRDGRLVKWLEPGRHKFRAWRAEFSVRTLDLDDGYIVATPELLNVIPEQAYNALTVKANQLAVLTTDGRPFAYLEPGKYLLWQLRAEVQSWLFDLDVVRADISDRFIDWVPSYYLATYTISDNQRGFLLCDGKIVDFVEPGRHCFWSRDRQVDMIIENVDHGYSEVSPECLAVIPEHTYRLLDVQDGHLAIVERDGLPQACVGPGRYVLWRLRHQVEAKVYSTAPLHTEVPEAARALVPSNLMYNYIVRPYMRGLLYVDGTFEGELGAGRYGIHCDKRSVEMHMVDMREQELQITGQEVMTSDKVTIRINVIVKFRVRDALASIESQQDLQASLYSEAQMAARRYIAGINIDALLEGRNEASQVMGQQLTARSSGWGIEVTQIDLKDIILPGEMKTLLNRVIEAEKQAQAQVIMRREETAATRSQANTAKMLENNPTLLRLKELEAVRDIAANIGQLTVVAGADDLLNKIKFNQ